MIYLDYAATTPVDPQVAVVLARYLTLDGVFANPSASTHRLGREASVAVERARAALARLVGASAECVIFTAGATESNNIAIQGVARGYQRKGRHLITSKTEHKAVLDVCRALEHDGFRVTYLDPNREGLIDPEQVRAAIEPDTLLVSIMHVNNETGVVQDIARLGRLCREYGVLLHVDGAQSVGKMPIDVEASCIDLLSVSGHKMYAPKGIGALIVRRRPKVRLLSPLHGGGQERGVRPGTLPTHQIVALGEAAALAEALLPEEHRRIAALRDRLAERLSALGGVVRHGCPQRSVSGILNLGFRGIEASALLDDCAEHLAAATGSACLSGRSDLSHVLQAMGVEAAVAAGSVRLSLGRFSTDAEINSAVDILSTSVRRLRALSPVAYD